MYIYVFDDVKIIILTVVLINNFLLPQNKSEDLKRFLVMVLLLVCFTTRLFSFSATAFVQIKNISSFSMIVDVIVLLEMTVSNANLIYVIIFDNCSLK